jgi:predicted PurR-regulated permease PerM
MGIPHYYVLAMLAFIGELLPYVGPLIVAVPRILIAMTISWSTTACVAGFFFVQQQIENQLLVPRIFERQVGLGAATVIVALLIGGELYGILGVILAVPTAAILEVLRERLIDEDAAPAA